MIKKLDIKYSMETQVAENTSNHGDTATILKNVEETHEEEIIDSENLQRLVPSKPKDFEIFFNLVNFTHQILQYHQFFFKDWVI